MTHIAIYARVSSDDQNLAGQEMALQKWRDCYAEGAEVKWYIDKHTGTTMLRPAWRKVEQALLDKQLEKLVIWKLDRLARTQLGTIQFCHEMIAMDVPLVSLTEGFDLGTAQGRMVMGILAAMAEFENAVRSERVKAGIEARRAKGLPIGGGLPGRRLKRETIEGVLNLLNSKKFSKQKIADICGVSRQAVYSILNHEGKGAPLPGDKDYFKTSLRRAYWRSRKDKGNRNGTIGISDNTAS